MPIIARRGFLSLRTKATNGLFKIKAQGKAHQYFQVGGCHFNDVFAFRAEHDGDGTIKNKPYAHQDCSAHKAKYKACVKMRFQFTVSLAGGNGKKASPRQCRSSVLRRLRDCKWGLPRFNATGRQAHARFVTKGIGRTYKERPNMPSTFQRHITEKGPVDAFLKQGFP